MPVPGAVEGFNQKIVSRGMGVCWVYTFDPSVASLARFMKAA